MGGVEVDLRSWDSLRMEFPMGWMRRGCDLVTVRLDMEVSVTVGRL